MKLLLIGGSSRTRQALKKLLGRSGHQLEWCGGEGDTPDPNPRNFDMVLVDGGCGDCHETQQLLDMAQRVRDRAPSLPILVLSLLDAKPGARCGGKRPDHSCGITQSPDGVWHMRCRLKDLAWNETVALLRDRVERPAFEPVTFEYQG